MMIKKDNAEKEEPVKAKVKKLMQKRSGAETRETEKMRRQKTGEKKLRRERQIFDHVRACNSNCPFVYSDLFWLVACPNQDAVCV